MPPQNNLKQHLKWLLTAKPFIPPSVPLVTYNPDDNTDFDAFSDELSVLNQIAANDEPAPTEQPATAPAPPVSDPPPRTLAQTKTFDIHSPPETEGDTDMARLRATPSNGRPRLVLAGVPRSGWSPNANRQQRGDSDVHGYASKDARSDAAWVTRE